MHFTLLVIGLSLFNADFSVCTYEGQQYYPRAIYQNNQYYVFWSDWRYLLAGDTSYAIYGARVTTSGTVVDSGGKRLFKNQAGMEPVVAYDGTNFLITFRDSC